MFWDSTSFIKHTLNQSPWARTRPGYVFIFLAIGQDLTKLSEQYQGTDLKPKDTAPKKYVFVVNPWCSLGGIGDQAFIDRVATWFYLMMKDRQETSNLAQVKQVFWQGTVSKAFYKLTSMGIYELVALQHKNIIVRFHADTDIEPCLGTHMWNRFLKPVLYTNNEQRSILYEYNYAKFESPIKNRAYFSLSSSKE